MSLGERDRQIILIALDEYAQSLERFRDAVRREGTPHSQTDADLHICRQLIGQVSEAIEATERRIDTQDLRSALALLESLARLVYDERNGTPPDTHINDIMAFVTEGSPEEFHAYQRLRSAIGEPVLVDNETGVAYGAGDLLTTSQVAALLDIDPSHVRRLAREHGVGRMPSPRVALLTVAEAEALRDRLKPGAGRPKGR